MKVSREDVKNIVEAAATAAAESHGQDVIRAKYEKVVLVALGRFQVLEFGLKRYIEKQAFLVEDATKKGSLLSGLEDLSLGLLIKRLKKLDPHEPLIEKVKKLLDFRNEIAHQALLEISGFSSIDVTKHFNSTIAYSFNALEVDDCIRELHHKLKDLQAGT